MPLGATIVQRLQRFGTYGRLRKAALRTVASQVPQVRAPRRPTLGGHSFAGAVFGRVQAHAPGCAAGATPPRGCRASPRPSCASAHAGCAFPPAAGLAAGGGGAGPAGAAPRTDAAPALSTAPLRQCCPAGLAAGGGDAGPVFGARPAGHRARALHAPAAGAGGAEFWWGRLVQGCGVGRWVSGHRPRALRPPCLRPTRAARPALLSPPQEGVYNLSPRECQQLLAQMDITQARAPPAGRPPASAARVRLAQRLRAWNTRTPLVVPSLPPRCAAQDGCITWQEFLASLVDWNRVRGAGLPAQLLRPGLGCRADIGSAARPALACPHIRPSRRKLWLSGGASAARPGPLAALPRPLRPLFAVCSSKSRGSGRCWRMPPAHTRQPHCSTS